MSTTKEFFTGATNPYAEGTLLHKAWEKGFGQHGVNPHGNSSLIHEAWECGARSAQTQIAVAGTRPSGVETVRSEMLVGIEPERQSVGWYYADDLLARAADLYGVHSASLAEHYKSDPIPWSELSAPTVRAWVAVARAPRY